MKLDAQVLRYMSREEFRVLTAVEMGMKNHELVPTALIFRIAGLKKGGAGMAYQALKTLHRNKLVYHEKQAYDGYRLTYLGYDYLALYTYIKKGLISGIGTRIGVGKEADIYICVNDQDEVMILKIHRLGRISFRNVKQKRDYLLHRKNASWLYLSRLAAMREYAYLKALYDHGFPVPVPYEQSRHTILMAKVDGVPFGQIRELSKPGQIYGTCMNLIVRLAEHGLIHCDFNEFNLMFNPETRHLTMIDFPQMVSTSHPNAKEYFDRDVRGVRTWFLKQYKYDSEEYPNFFTDTERSIALDEELKASGAGVNAFSKEQQEEYEQYRSAANEFSDAELEEEEEEDIGDAPDEQYDGSDYKGNDDEAVETLESEEEEEESSKKSKKDKKKSKKKVEQDDEQEEEESEDEDEKRRARMARKDERQHANRMRQAMKDARKSQKAAAQTAQLQQSLDQLTLLQSSASSSTDVNSMLPTTSTEAGDEENEEDEDNEEYDETTSYTTQQVIPARVKQVLKRQQIAVKHNIRIKVNRNDNKNKERIKLQHHIDAH